MPFAGYPDFDACVNDNKDKDDPGAFCAWLEKKATGKMSAEMTQGLPRSVREKFESTFEVMMTEKSDEVAAMKAALVEAEAMGWSRRKGGWGRRSDNAKIPTRSIYGVPIFAVGTHNGDVYKLSDLQDMVMAFTALKGRIDPPVKIGHTTDAFNVNLAKKMGIAPEFIKGENGNGAMAFGWISRLRLHGKILFADLADVPEPIADLIDSKSFNKVSCEVMFNLEDKGKKWPKVVTGLALLGSEMPAVKDTGLELAAVYMRTNAPDSAIEYQEGEDEVFEGYPLEQCVQDQTDRYGDTETAKKVCAAIKSRAVKNIEELPAILADIEKKMGIKVGKTKKEDMMEKEIYAELGVAENASKEEVMAAIKNLKESALFKDVRSALGLDDKATLADVQAAVKKLQDQVSAGNKEAVSKFADMETKIKKLSVDLSAEKRTNRLREYTMKFTELKAISGKPEDLAKELVDLEDIDPKAAERVFAHYKATNDQLVTAGILTVKGNPLAPKNDEHDFIKASRKYAEDNHISVEAAQLKVRETNPDLWREYRKNNRPVAGVSTGDEEES